VSSITTVRSNLKYGINLDQFVAVSYKTTNKGILITKTKQDLVEYGKMHPL
jgi:hypothetical protein